MASFIPAAKIEVGHAYFTGNRGRFLRVIPTATTADFLQRYGMVARDQDGDMLLLVDQERLRVLAGLGPPEFPNVLEFMVGSTDPLCLTYTHPRSPGESLPLLDGDSDVFRVEFVAAELAGALASDGGHRRLPAALGVASSWTVLARLSILVAALWKVGIGELCEPRLACHTRMDSRKYIWKYLFLGDYRGRQLSVVDAGGQVVFCPAEDERIDDRSTAIVIRSACSVALEERPTCRFQLLDTSITPNRVLIRRLPAAAPGRAHREVVSGEPQIVSEIFINR